MAASIAKTAAPRAAICPSGNCSAYASCSSFSSLDFRRIKRFARLGQGLTRLEISVLLRHGGRSRFASPLRGLFVKVLASCAAAV